MNDMVVTVTPAFHSASLYLYSATIYIHLRFNRNLHTYNLRKNCSLFALQCVMHIGNWQRGTIQCEREKSGANVRIMFMHFKLYRWNDCAKTSMPSCYFRCTTFMHCTLQFSWTFQCDFLFVFMENQFFCGGIVFIWFCTEQTITERHNC